MQEQQHLNTNLKGQELETEAKRYAFMKAGVDSVFYEVDATVEELLNKGEIYESED